MLVGAVVVACVVGARGVAAQAPAGASSIPVDTLDPALHRWTYGGWVAFGANQPLRTRLGHVYDRALGVAAIRGAYLLNETDVMAARYTIDVLPLVLATRNPWYDVRGVCALEQCTEQVLAARERHSTAYGIGVTPLGIDLQWAPHARLSVVTSFAGGGVLFDQAVPDPEATHFNFTAEGVLGIRIHTAGGFVTAGVRWYHISNGSTGRVNPAMDSRLLFVALSR